MMMRLRDNFLLLLAVLVLGAAGNALAGEKEGGIGGTGSVAHGSGMGGTGAPALEGGIGGTGSPALAGGIGGTGAVAGKVMFIMGHVEAQNQGQTRVLAKGDVIRAGEELKSDAGATLQLRMEDNGTLVLRPASRLVIEAFDYKGGEDGKARMALMLLDGGFRAVTGEIGHLHKENYTIRTPNARVGIMGTDHETVFVPEPAAGQTAAVEPGTYDHVFSGATLLQSDKGRVLIQPSQTGFAAINGANPVLLGKPVPIFGGVKMNVGAGDQHGGDGNAGASPGSDNSPKADNNNTNNKDAGNAYNNTQSSSGQASGSTNTGTSQNPGGDSYRLSQNSSNNSGSGQNSEQQYSGANNSTWNQGANYSNSNSNQSSSDPTQSTQQNKVTQTDNLANTTLDISTLDISAESAHTGSVVAGAQVVNGALAAGTAQAGRGTDQLLVEDGVPTLYTNNTTGFNFISTESVDAVNTGSATVDGVAVNWGIYASGITFDKSGNPININYHPFAYANEGVTSQSRITAIGGTATFSSIAGSAPPVTESGKVGGSMTLNVGVDLGNGALTSYNLAVTDANSRNWTGTLSNSVSLATFAQNGAPLSVTCAGCGSGSGSGLAAGALVGQNAKGLITSYALGTTTGQSVMGAAVLSRP